MVFDQVNLPKIMYSSFTTQLDALANGGGSLDPMGLYAIADRMAMTLVPGVRERMSNLRYLTASAYGAEVCRGMSDEKLIQARLEPYMALEFHLVSGWIYQFRDHEEEDCGIARHSKVAGVLSRRSTSHSRQVFEDGFGVWFSWCVSHSGDGPSDCRRALSAWRSG